MATEHGYNGWRNHATWVIGLHFMDTVVSWIIDDIDVWIDDAEGNNIYAASQLFKDLLEDQIEASGIATYPLLLDLLSTNDIDWRSLGAAALDAADIKVPASI